MENNEEKLKALNEAAEELSTKFAPEKRTASEFGKGLIYPLVLFLEHCQNEQASSIGHKSFIMSKTEAEREEILSPNPRPEMNYGSWVKDIKWWYEHIVPIRGTAEKTLSSDIALWANGASDHLSELDDEANFMPELKEEIAELKSTGLEMGHGFTEYERMWTLADMQELHNKALHILYEIDKKIGSNPIEATWK